MNYYNPYFSAIPYSYTPTVSASRGLLGGLFGSGRLSSIISGTQKTLGLVNQTIPLVKQMKPVINNAKTMFKVMNEFKKVGTTNKPEITKSSNRSAVNTIPKENNSNQINQPEIIQNDNGPTFFL